MAVFFNPIACTLPLSCGTELELTGKVIGRMILNAIKCPRCGIQYNLIVPIFSSGSDVQAYTENLCVSVSNTCGVHPPIIQRM